MTVLSYGQLQNLWNNAGGPPAWAPTMAAIALLESGGNTQASNPSGATGLWQVEWPLHSDLSPDGSRQALYDPTVNAKAAIAILNGGAGLCSGWGTVQGGDALGIAVCRGGSTPWTTAQIQSNGFGQYTGAGGTSGNVGAGDASLQGLITAAGGCNTKGPNGDGKVFSTGGILGFGSFTFTYCELKALTGGLFIGLGGGIMLVGTLLTVGAALGETALGRQGTQTAGTAVQYLTLGRVSGARATSAMRARPPRATPRPVQQAA